MNSTDKENTMKWYHSMLTDGTDEGISSKRVVTLLAFILCTIAFIANLFWNLDIKDSIFEGMMYIAIAGLGFTASEKFTKK
jgi:dolichyl-phosphate-mannose--protein O-mannosyl transferase